MAKQYKGFQNMPKGKLQVLCQQNGLRLRPRAAREMTEIERAWLGAFIEADGCTFIRRDPRLTRPKLVINISQKEIDPIATALRITQAGRVQWSPLRPHPQWAWNVYRLNDSLSIARQCAPYSWKLQRVLAEYGG